MSLAADPFASTPSLDPSPEEVVAAGEAEFLADSVARAERRLAVLAELTEIGLDLTRLLHGRAAAAGAGREASAAQLPPTQSAKLESEDFAAGFGKLSRSLRLTLDLEGRADEALRALRSGEVTARAAHRVARERGAAEATERRAAAAREKLVAQVEMAIVRESECDADEYERGEALEERLDEDDAYWDLTDRSLRETVEQLCADLELSPDWSTWTDDGWPEPVRAGPAARKPWSPFHQASRRPSFRTVPAPRPDRTQLSGP